MEVDEKALTLACQSYKASFVSAVSRKAMRRAILAYLANTYHQAQPNKHTDEKLPTRD